MYPSAMLAIVLHPLIEDKQIKPYSLIRITDFDLCNHARRHGVLVVLGIELVQSDVDGPIGNANLFIAALSS